MCQPITLLKIVRAFLQNRKMVVRYQGATSSVKNLPGAGPQGTLLELLLFLVLINDAGFQYQENNIGERVTSRKNFKAANLLHLKKQLVSVPETDRPLPDCYHARTGYALPVENSKVMKQLHETRNYAETNSMKINYKKTKVMVFDKCKKWDFMPELEVEGNRLELEEEMRILGLVVRSDLK